MGILLAAIAAIAAIEWLLVTPSEDVTLRVSLSRVFLALIAFFLSSDVFGTLEGHRAAARSICSI